MAQRTGLAHLPVNVLAPLAALALVAACGSGTEAPATRTPSAGATARASASPPQSSGIQGQALAGPQCPVERADSPCPDKPLQASVEVWTGDRTRKLTTFTTGADGTFHVPLPRGDYYLVPLPPSPGRSLPRGTPQVVTVAPEQWTDVTLRYDTGLR